MTAPIKVHRNWRHLLKDVLSSPPGKLLYSYPQDFLKTVLVAPVTLARWIAFEQPHLMERPTLHVVIAGAAKGLDSIDEGRWYQFVPYLLGKPSLKFSVTLVGPELRAGEDHPSLRTGNDRAGIFTSAGAAAVAAVPMAEVAADTLAAWWATRDTSESLPDACFLFHPGFESFGGSWFSDKEGFIPLIQAEVPIGCTAACVEELWQEDWLVQQYGYAMRGPSTPNPFALPRDNPKFSGEWANLIWTLNTTPPPPDFVVRKPELVRFYLAMDMAKPGFSAAGNAIFGFVGGVFEVKNKGDAAVARLVGMPAGVLLSLDTGEVMGQNLDGDFEILPKIESVPLKFVSDFPGETSHPVERFIWACEKFRGFIEPVLLAGGGHRTDKYEDLFIPAQPTASNSKTSERPLA